MGDRPDLPHMERPYDRPSAQAWPLERRAAADARPYASPFVSQALRRISRRVSRGA